MLRDKAKRKQHRTVKVKRLAARGEVSKYSPLSIREWGEESEQERVPFLCPTQPSDHMRKRVHFWCGKSPKKEKGEERRLHLLEPQSSHL